jgi:hypothetical protein
VVRVAGGVEHGDADGRAGIAADQAGEVEPAAPVTGHGIPRARGVAVEQERRVEVVAAAGGQPAVAAPADVGRAVELDRSPRRELEVEVERVRVGGEIGVGQAALVLDDHAAVGADPAHRAGERRAVDRGRGRVVQGAERLDLLPEVLSVHELDREPQAVVPRMAGRAVARQHVARGGDDGMEERLRRRPPVVRPPAGALRRDAGLLVDRDHVRHRPGSYTFAVPTAS